jgi:hypothetical protein
MMVVMVVWLRVSLWVWLMARRELLVCRQWRRWYALQTCTDEGNLEGRELNLTVASHKSARLGGWPAGDA